MSLDSNLAYWTCALANLGLVAVCACAGVYQVRRGNVRLHRRLMLGSASLVGLFLSSYVVKVLLLGREHLESWSFAAVTVLRVHEVGVALMLVAGGAAGYQAWRFRRTLGTGPLAPPSPANAARRRLHRRAGRVAVGGSLLAFALAIAVLAGMYARAGG